MSKITIFGKGNMAQAIGKNFEISGQVVEYYGSKDTATHLGDIVVLAIPYGAVHGLVEAYKEQLEGKIVIDITNPVNFETFDGLVTPADGSGAQEIANVLPESIIVKAFNTNFASTLATQNVGGNKTVVLMASDDENAKEVIADALVKSGLIVKDAGSLKRARELEALGFLQISLAAREQITWTGGFSLVE